MNSGSNIFTQAQNNPFQGGGSYQTNSNNAAQNNIFNRNENSQVFQQQTAPNSIPGGYNNPSFPSNSIANNPSGGNIFQQNQANKNNNVNYNGSMFNSSNSVTTLNSHPYNNGYNNGATIYNNTNNNLIKPNKTNNNIAPLIGSQRGKYEITKSQLADANGSTSSQVALMSTSIIFCKGFSKLSVLLLRLEDYYSIRTGKLSDQDKQRVNGSISQNCFNAQLFSTTSNLIPPNIPAINNNSNKDFPSIPPRNGIDPQNPQHQLTTTAGSNPLNNNLFNHPNNNYSNSQIQAANSMNNFKQSQPNQSGNFPLPGPPQTFASSNIAQIIPGNGSIFSQSQSASFPVQSINPHIQNNNCSIFAGQRNQSNDTMPPANQNTLFAQTNHNNNQQSLFNQGNQSQNVNQTHQQTTLFGQQQNNLNVFSHGTSHGQQGIQQQVFQNGQQQPQLNSLFSNQQQQNQFQNSNSIQLPLNNNNNAAQKGNNNQQQQQLQQQQQNFLQNPGNQQNLPTLFGASKETLPAASSNVPKQQPQANNNNNNTNLLSLQSQSGSSNNSSNNRKPSTQQSNNSLGVLGVFGANAFLASISQDLQQGNASNSALGSDYFPLDQGKFFAPYQKEVTLAEYMSTQDNQLQQKQKMKQSYFMPAACPEDYAPMFQQKQAHKPIYIVSDSSMSKSLTSQIFKLAQGNKSSEDGGRDVLQINQHFGQNNIFKDKRLAETDSAIKAKQKRELFNFYQQPKTNSKDQELSLRRQLAQDKPLLIRVEALCQTPDGYEEEITLTSEVDTTSKLKSVGMFCKDKLLRSGRMTESTRPIFTQIYFEGRKLQDLEQLVNDVLPQKFDPVFKCEVIYEFDRRPFMRTSQFALSPSLAELQRMSIRELKCVENFVVEGHFGKLEWLNPVDLVNLDIDKTIQIEDQCIQVYPETEFLHGNKPIVGQGINGKCKVTYKNASVIAQQLLSGQVNKQKMLSCIQKQCADLDVQFLYFDENELTWTILVEHFSGYQFNLGEQEQQPAQQQQQQSQQQQQVANTNANILPQQSFGDNSDTFSRERQNQQFQQQQYSQRSYIPGAVNPSKREQEGIQEGMESQTNPLISQQFNRNRLPSQDIIFHKQTSSQKIQMQQQEQQQRQAQQQRNQIKRDNIDDVIHEEAEFGSMNDTHPEIEIESGAAKNYSQTLKQQQYRQQNTQNQNYHGHQQPQQFLNVGVNLQNRSVFNDFKKSIEKRKNIIKSIEKQASKNEKPSIASALINPANQGIVKGIITLNQCAFQHPMKECASGNKKIYFDLASSPSFSAKTLASYSSSTHSLRQHSFVHSHIGRVNVNNNKDSLRKYNSVVINGFLTSLLEAQHPGIFEEFARVAEQFENGPKPSNFRLFEAIPDLVIPSGNNYSVFLILYLKNHLAPAMAQAERQNHMDVLQALNDELNILALINILFGNPQVDIVEIFNKIRLPNGFSGFAWTNLIGSLRDQHRQLRNDVAQNLRRKQIKKYFQSKFQRSASPPSSSAYKGNEDIEEYMMACLKRRDIVGAVKIAEDNQLCTLALILTTFETESYQSDSANRSIDPNLAYCFPRVMNFLSGNLEEIYKSNRTNQMKAQMTGLSSKTSQKTNLSSSGSRQSSLSVLNSFACELWYEANQRKSLAQIFDEFVAKNNGKLKDDEDLDVPVEILLLGLYAQEQLGEDSSESLKSIKLFVHLNSASYAKSRLDKRLSWFIIEIMNAKYFFDDKQLLKDKRARLMRGFLEQLSQQGHWKEEILVILFCKQLLKKNEFVMSIRDLFLRNCHSDKCNFNNNKSPLMKEYDSFEQEELQSVKQLLLPFFHLYSNEAQGLYHYSNLQYAESLNHLIQEIDRDPLHAGLCNKMITYHEGPRVILFGKQSEREDLEKHLLLISQQQNLLPRYRLESGLISQVVQLLLLTETASNASAKIVFELKNVLIATQNYQSYLSYSKDQFKVVEAKSNCVIRQSDASKFWIYKGNALFKEFIAFVFEELAAKVPDMRRYSSHRQTSNDVQELIEIISENRAPNGEQIKQFILSTLPHSV